jgi:hypothetical protein
MFDLGNIQTNQFFDPGVVSSIISSNRDESESVASPTISGSLSVGFSTKSISISGEQKSLELHF